MKSPIFIVGLHRTGSTLWHNLVAMCPDVMRLTETRFLGRQGQRDFRYFLKTHAGDLSTDDKIEKMVELCFSKKNVPGLEGAFWRFENIEAVEKPELRREICRKIKESDKSMRAIVRIFLDEITRFSGYGRACVKFPVDVAYIPQLLEWYPECKVVHITRDPRAMAISKTNDPFGTAIKVREYPYLAWPIRKIMILFEIIQYRRTARIHLRFKNLANYRLFRYEDLLAQPEKVLRELCEFMGTEFRADMLHPESGQHEHQKSSVTGKRQQAFDVNAAIRWQTVISRTDAWMISLLAGDSMKKMEYYPETHPIFRMSQREVPAAQNHSSGHTAGAPEQRKPESKVTPLRE
jgi:Sulfotransferase family